MFEIYYDAIKYLTAVPGDKRQVDVSSGWIPCLVRGMKYSNLDNNLTLCAVYMEYNSSTIV